MQAAVSEQVFAKEQCLAGLRAAADILENWGASKAQACCILRISLSTFNRAKQRAPGWSVSLDSDQMKRVSIVLNIHAALRQIFDNPDNCYGFPAMANDNSFFNGRSPLEIMSQGDMVSLYETFRHIEALQRSQW